jgi:hypothetical protein
MSFDVRLAADLLQVEPGATVPLAIAIENRSETAETLEISVEGIEPEWVAVPVPTFDVGPNEKQEEKVFFKPPRESSSLAGSYPLVVSVRSLESGQVKKAQAVLEVKAFNNVSLDVNPKRATVTSRTSKRTFEANLLNLGNSEHTFQMFAHDPDGIFALEFEDDQVTVAPGQQRTVGVNAAATRRPFLANPRLQGVSLSCRSTLNPSAGASVQAQIEQRPVISPSAFFVALLVIALLGIWYVFMPRPPQVSQFEVSQTRVEENGNVGIKWDTYEAEEALLVVSSDEQELVRVELDSSGNGDISLENVAPGEVILSLSAISGDSVSDAVERSVTILEAEAPPLPEILSFRTSAEQVVIGEPFVLTYELGPNVERAVLVPSQVSLNVDANRYEITPEDAGTKSYDIFAYNEQGDMVSTAEMSPPMTVQVEVIDESRAEIVEFEATPKVVDPLTGLVRLRWQVDNTERVEIRYGGGEPIIASGSGSTDVRIDETTVFTLIAYDEFGLTQEQTLEVVAREMEPDVGIQLPEEEN